MANRVLEICVESVDHGVAAERGGAHRIELCSDLPSGGITPSAGLMRAARSYVQIPIHVLIRPRPGDFCYSDREFEIMHHDILAAKHFGMGGIVLGLLHKDGRVDLERTKAFVELARPLPVTFHRAFDASENFDVSLEDVIKTGASRILTSGGQSRATDALSTLSELVRKAAGRIAVMPGGGINPSNVVGIVQTTRASEIHSSAGTSGPEVSGNGQASPSLRPASGYHVPSAEFEQRVAELAHLLNGVVADEPAL
jgi:copper homeostasis protein